MIQSLPYDETKFDKNVQLDDILDTEDDFDIVYFHEINLKNPNEMKEKTSNFPFFPENRRSLQDIFSDYMNE